MAAPSASWYNDAEYSDLTLKLSDGREIKVHKLVICKQNEYFRKLCGATSSFKEADQTVITLQEDSADAVEEVLRKIYGCPLPAASTRDWRFWFALITTADKYLEQGLSAKADQHFREAALGISDADVVFDVVQELKADMSHVEPLLGFAEVLRKKNLTKLLKNERYRDLLLGDPERMLAQLDELEEGLEMLQQQKGSKRQYSLCAAHAAAVFRPTKNAVRACSLCPTPHQLFPLVKGIADVPPPRFPE